MSEPTSTSLVASRARAAELRAAAAAWPSHTLAPDELAALELALVGAADLSAVTIAAPDMAEPGARIALREPEGEMLAALIVERAGGRTLTGAVEGVALPAHPDYPALRPEPAAVRADVVRLRWDRPLAVLVPGLLHTAELDRLAAAGRPLLLLVAAGGADPADAAHHGRVRALVAAADTLPGPVHLILTPLTPGTARAVAGAPPAPGVAAGDPGAAASSGGSPEEVGARAAVAYGGADHIVAAPEPEVEAEIRRLLDRGEPVPATLTPPAVAAELARQRPPRPEQGLTVFFTGLSGSGKSTVANLLAVRLLEGGDRPVTLLDGDRVRLHLSKGLGFSRADRDENVRRIGFVAAQVVAAGGVAVCAPIAPYDAVRREVRAMSERTGGFVLVHVATPIEVCEARDRKGHYAKARAGELTGFTGVDDPYEEPADAQVSIDTSTGTPENALEAVLDHLAAAGWITGE